MLMECKTKFHIDVEFTFSFKAEYIFSFAAFKKRCYTIYRDFAAMFKITGL